VLAIAALVVGIALAASGGGRSTSAASSDARAGSTSVAGPVQVVVRPASWSLAAPISREGAVALGDGRVLLVGGLTAADTSSPTVSLLDVASGAQTPVGSLAEPTHDAGVAALGGSVFVLGGGQAASVAAVERFPAPSPAAAAGAASTPPAAVAQVVGQLPDARSDDTAVAVGATVYVVGGYDGRTADPSVLATSDGRQFTAVASLAVPVRYAAVAAVGGELFVFGGEAASGPDTGQPVDDVQVVDPATGRSSVVGHLPAPVEGAAAVDLAGRVLVIGGDVPADAGSAGSLVTTADVLSYDPTTAATTVAASLPVPVAYAGVADFGTSAWVVGGERNGAVVATAQEILLRSARR
jgi:N-acetylneuraminic acid mutarotase